MNEKAKDKVTKELREMVSIITDSEDVAVIQRAIAMINELSEAVNYYEGKADGMEQIIDTIFGK